MKQVFLLIFLTLSFCASNLGAQVKSLDSIQVLEEVVLSDVKLKRYAKGHKVTVLNDSVLSKNGRSLTDLLRFNSNIHFKENGYGMVSSPSFRGTNASQTAVVWNGININSQLNGQVDFNTISSINYDAITIRSGGGSVQYGSGAIGGSVHLSNNLNFKRHCEQYLQLGYGSFNSKSANYKASFANGSWSGNLGVGIVDSENDYLYLGTNKKNENGAFYNLDISLNVGYVLSKSDVVKFYHQNFQGSREFSGTLAASSNSKYNSEDFRSMLEWSHIKSNHNSNLKAVRLVEKFKYFENRANDNFSEGQAETWLLKHRYTRQFSKDLSLSIITDLSHIKGKGSSFSNPERNALSATAILSHRANKNTQYNLNIRKDAITDFKSPLVFSGDISYAVAAPYTLKLNASKNFRVPTFNDLFWQPGGNLDLEPESSYQLDLGHELVCHGLSAKLNTFYIESSNLIQWRPNTVTGYWNPVNIANAQHFGLESEFSFNKRIKAHNFLFVGAYSYTQAKDVEKNQPLFYVPRHKANASLSYGYKSLTVFYQHLYNDEVDIIGRALDGFDVGNLGVSYKLRSNKEAEYGLDFKINNLYNSYYENVALRPMPNRNFNIKLSIKF